MNLRHLGCLLHGCIDTLQIILEVLADYDDPENEDGDGGDDDDGLPLHIVDESKDYKVNRDKSISLTAKNENKSNSVLE